MKLNGSSSIGFAWPFALLVLALAPLGCAASVDDSPAEIAQEAVGVLSISGTITDVNGHALGGVPLALTGSAIRVVTTAANGTYAFTALAPGSYIVVPTKAKCLFNPPLHLFFNLKSSTTANFVGRGSQCVAADAGSADGGSDAVAESGDARPDMGVDASSDGGDATADGGTDGTTSCAPPSCPVGQTCGVSCNACGACVNCGACPGGMPCMNGTCCLGRAQCAPGQTCGTASSACETINCGTCPLGLVCNGLNCLCPPATCAAGQNCGTATNSCGNTIDCGTCTGLDTCGGGGQPGVCGSPCDINTESCVRSRDLSPNGCYQCGVDLGCFDPQFGGYTCESGPRAAETVPACQSLLSTPSAPTESQVCLATLKGMFSSHCAAGMQLNPCLCGTTPQDTCLNNSAAPTGALAPIYKCDLGIPPFPFPDPNINGTRGASVANGIVECLQAFMCDCQY